MLTNNLGLISIGIYPHLITLRILVINVLSIIVDLLKQLVIKDTSKPPPVFHWLPIIGNTITYGRDPLKFFKDCKEKVSSLSKQGHVLAKYWLTRSSMAMSSPSSC